MHFFQDAFQNDYNLNPVMSGYLYQDCQGSIKPIQKQISKIITHYQLQSQTVAAHWGGNAILLEMIFYNQ